MKDFKVNIAPVLLLEPQTIAHVDTVSSILDLAGFDGAVMNVTVAALTGVDSSNYLTPVLQESDTVVGTDFADVAAANMNGAFTKIDSTAKDSVIQSVGYKGSKRYIRVNLDYTGTGITAGVVGVSGTLGYPDVFPAVGPAAITAT